MYLSWCEINVIIIIIVRLGGLAGRGVGSRFMLMWSAYVHMAALVEYTYVTSPSNKTITIL